MPCSSDRTPRGLGQQLRDVVLVLLFSGAVLLHYRAAGWRPACSAEAFLI
jgi:hypothetical protein